MPRYDDEEPRRAPNELLPKVSPSASSLRGYGDNFEKARTTKEMPNDLGDSERWGSSDDIVVRANEIVSTQQLVRVQMKEGRARIWHGFWGFTMRQLPVSVAYAAVGRLDISFATGQFRHDATLFGFGNVNPANGLLTAVNTYTNTTLFLDSRESWFANFFAGGSFPIPDVPATSIVITATFALFTNVVNDSMRLTAFANVAPRAAS